jgi:hypothetical protein
VGLNQLLHLIGTLALLGYAIASLFWPHRVAKLIEQTISTPRGVAEFRIANGGFFAGMSLFALFTNQAPVYTALGLGWLGAAMARTLSFVLDRPKLDASYMGFFVMEVALGLCLVA